jgi:hypothetical protein
VMAQLTPLAGIVEGSIWSVVEPLRLGAADAAARALRTTAVNGNHRAANSVPRAAVAERGAQRSTAHAPATASALSMTGPSRGSVTPGAAQPAVAPAATSSALLAATALPSSTVVVGAPRSASAAPATAVPATPTADPTSAPSPALVPPSMPTLAPTLTQSPTPAATTSTPVAAVATPTPTLSSALPTPAPTPAPSPARTPAPSPARTPAPSPARTPAPSCVTVTGFDARAVQAARDTRASVICFPAGRYAGEVPANVPGQTWSLDPNAVFTWRVWVQADGVTIRGGRIEQGLADPYSHNVTILGASHATIEDMVIVGEGLISIHGSDFNRVRNNKLVGPGCGSIFLWGGATKSANDNLIEGNRIECGMIGSRGSDGPPPLVLNRRNVVRNNVVQNSNWMAIEFARSPQTLIEGNTLTGHHVPGGGGTIVSLPVSDESIVRGNTLISLSGDWGVELAASNDVTVEDNDIFGTVLSPGVAAINHNSGSTRSVIRFNRVRDYSAFVDLGPRAIVTDNCMTNVPVLFRYDDGTNTLARNGPC